MVYRDIRLGYYLAVLAGGGLLAALGVQGVLGLYPAIGLGVVWVIFCALVVNVLERRRLIRLNELRNQCHLRAYAAACDKLYQSALARKDNRTQRLLLINRSTACLDLGQPRQALELLEHMEWFFRADTHQPALLLAYYNNMAMCYFRLKEWDRAQGAVEQYKQTLDSANLNEGQRGGFYLMYQTQAMLLDMGRGDYVGAEKFFLRALERERAPIGQVFYQACLLKIYLHQGEEAKQQACLEFLSAHGGDTCFAQAARDLLRQRGAQRTREG